MPDQTVTKEAIFKGAAPSKQTMYCVVTEPDTEDLQGDTMTPDEIEKMAHSYLLDYRVVSDSHSKDSCGTLVIADAGIVESFIAPADFQVGTEQIRKGSWVVAIKVFDSEMWSAVEKGDITGVSIGGTGERVSV